MKKCLSFSPLKQSMTNVAAGSTTVMRMPSAPTPSRDTAAPANRATWATGPSVEVGWPCRGKPWAAALPELLVLLWQIHCAILVAEHGQHSCPWTVNWQGHCSSEQKVLWVSLLGWRKKVWVWFRGMFPYLDGSLQLCLLACVCDGCTGCWEPCSEGMWALLRATFQVCVQCRKLKVSAALCVWSSSEASALASVCI